MTTRRNLVLVGVVLVSMLGFGTAMSSWTDTGLAGSPDDRRTVVDTEVHTQPMPRTTNVETEVVASPTPTSDRRTYVDVDTITPTPTPDAGRECRPDPTQTDGVDADEYEYDTHGMTIPDRYVDEMLSMEGVTALTHGDENIQGGPMYLLEHEEGARPVPYCDFPGFDKNVFAEWQTEIMFTPLYARSVADPTHDRGMDIADESVAWLLGHDHVHRVKHVQTCYPDGTCASEVRIYVEKPYPPEDIDRWGDRLPKVIDGVDVEYVETEVADDRTSTYWCDTDGEGRTYCT